MKLVVIIAASLVMIFGQSVTVWADATADLQSSQGDSLWYDPNSCSTDTSQAADLSSVTPGQGAPDGGTFPKLDPTAMANAIDTWVAKQNPNSKLKGLGKTIVASAKHSNINPFILVAIPKEESNLADQSVFNVYTGNNAYGRSAAPGQPSFQGDRAWYKWSSVEASVDYTAAENQGAKGGGDMASYLRAQFPSDIDTGDIVSLMNKYAPPSENDTTGYINNLKGWISELVTLAGGTPSASTTPTADTSQTGQSQNACGGVCSSTATATGATNGKTTIALDPGHSPDTDPNGRDATTGLYDQDYSNAPGPEMQDVFDSATKIKAQLVAKGYNVVMTKSSATDKIDLSQRAQRANASGANLLVTLHENNDSPTASYWLGYPDSSSVRIPGATNDTSKRTDGKAGLVHPEIAEPSQKFAKIIAPIVASKIGQSYTARSFNDIYGANGLGGNGKNYGNTPVQTVLSSIPEVYSEVKWGVATSDAFVSAMAEAIQKAVPLGTPPGIANSASDGGCGAVSGNVIQTALNYAWADGRNTPAQKPSYATAVAAALKAGEYVGGGTPVGDDCGGFITRVMHNSGADPDYGNGGYTVLQEQSMTDRPNKYKLLHPTSTADLQPGDIAVNADHTYMYVGKQPGFATTIASASLENRAPTAGGELPADPSFHWYRMIN
jgi:N-acetylmuramoyl-L-alanine amidase